ncbi:MAG: (E)-4-hydroxy-3-methylbut-2-enyl-diphosphate synthase [Bacteroidia bacterium]|nr:(E)-4-hydroxy-3-methylbut-2-enyl-diphosphate synthase [Bacteroidia bacterium]MDW8159771.1 (E)-4-hydroxy-3-methylbut-2-enyl-diphosphate synthase [Bacteroidia bacterium]
MLEQKIVSFKEYCLSLTQYKRLPTIEVPIGEVPVGGKNPIRIQSMTTTNTLDTTATVAQAIRMIEAGCEYIRITAPSIKEAENLKNIKAELRKRGYQTPLVADIHYTPNAAEIAARIVEKVRINPGNYADKKKFQLREYTDAEYQAELERIYQRFAPLVKICRVYGTAMRIGTNHGSLSDRIMSRYGDTPEGMVQSALEFVDICEDLGFYQIVISMKASNPQIMVQAYRLLVHHMFKRGRLYPLHLGVTEAGEGEDGRIKSAIGIGALLADGIGDTVRVSLTEPPEMEMPVARFIIKHVAAQNTAPSHSSNNNISNSPPCVSWENIPDPFSFQRRKTIPVFNIGGTELPRVIAHWPYSTIEEKDLHAIGHYFSFSSDKWNMKDWGADFIYLADMPPSFMLPNGLKAILNYSCWREYGDEQNTFPYFENYAAWISAEKISSIANFVAFTPEELLNVELLPGPPSVIVLKIHTTTPLQQARAALLELNARQSQHPLVIKAYISPLVEDNQQTPEAIFQLSVSTLLSNFLIDGWVDGIWLVADNNSYPLELVNRTAFATLQGARLRMTRTEYISCPSCGRTLFDLQETTAKIRQKTEHLKGVKIAIMGCIVNGPGEMADADYGYVGAGPGIISLYRGKEMVEKAVKTEFAVERLIELIRQDGKWIEPTEVTT